MEAAETEPAKLPSTADIVKEFKRQGKFDLLRKEILKEFSDSPRGQELFDSLSNMDIESDFMTKLSNAPSFKTLNSEIMAVDDDRESKIKQELESILEELKR